MIEPCDREIARLLPSRRNHINAVVGDLRNRDQVLWPFRSLVGEDPVVLVVHQLFLFGDDKLHGYVGRAIDVLDWKPRAKLHADRGADQLTHAVGARRRLASFTSPATNG